MSASPRELTPTVLDVALRAAVEVEGLCDDLRPWLLEQAGEVGSRAKGDGTPVTEVDLESDRRIRDRLTTAFPDHDVLSEEGDTTWRGAEWTWVVDPVDGTSNFTSGLPFWCVSIALLHEGVPVLGCVEAPPLGARFVAVRGRGATRNGAPMTVADPVDFRSGRNAHVPFIVTSGTIRRASGDVRLNARILGAAALDLALVACGVAIATHQRVPKIWDMAAGSLLVEEAGGAHVPLADPLLPPAPGTDMKDRSCPSMAGPDEAWLRDLAEAL
jgi:myo-inositol-1(or 4)-monophosphatase